MNHHFKITSFLFGLTFLLPITNSVTVSAEDPIDYKTEIKPLFAEKCFACHGGLKQESSLRLDSGHHLLKGSENGKIIIPGHPEESEILGVLTGEAGFQMPPEGEGTPFNKEELELVQKWILQGAHFPEDDQPESDPRKFWSYQPVSRPEIPNVNNQQWIKTPIDAFISAKQEELKLTPVEPASPEKLIRRLYLDLIGLPPTPAQLKAFLNDPSDENYEKIVDTLLNSPQYGERWGRHWMDIWRYSDWYGSTAANEIRNSQYHIWHWRDWIIESLNQDKGYDQMIREMLAADELAPNDEDKIRATGYLARNWYKFNRTTWLIDTIEHTNMAFLGITMKCARCHDHKYDPVSQKDYYSFRAIFEPHSVRLDRIPEEKDIQKNGIPRVYDEKPAVKTFLFVRGDERSPDKENPLSAGVPKILGELPFVPKEISLPIEAFYQEMRPELIEEKIQAIRERLNVFEKELEIARKEKAQAEQKIASVHDLSTSWREDVIRDAPGTTILDFNSFANPSDHWTEKDGKWSLVENQLQTDVPASGKTIRLISKQNHPENFYARLSYRPSQPGNYRSIGFSYDYIQPGVSQDIYTSTGDQEQSVQAFHRVDGKDVYPYSGIVKTSLKVNELTTVEVVARGRDLRIWLNGKLVLDYIMPIRRQPGKFAIWVYSGTARFQDFELRALDETPEDLKRKHSETSLTLAMKEKDYQIVQSELTAFPARVSAEKAKYQSNDPQKVKQLKKEALIAEKQAELLKKEKDFLVSHHFKELVSGMDSKAIQGLKPLMDDAKVIQETALTALNEMKKTMASPQGELKPLGEPYSPTSTGRRLALANWMTHPENPRTSRIAVNHIWLRHFGEGIVPTVTDFGVRSKPRSHPELLDWLSSELIENQWKMKPIHKLIVMSSTYRLSTVAHENPDNQKTDPDNRYLWRMNSRRMEAEVIRDSLLFASGQLDLTLGGPDLPAEMKNDNSETPFRRSLYYKTTPDKRMSFLDQFDAANPLQCYARKVSVVPQQALAMINSRIAQNSARLLAKELKNLKQDEFIEELYVRFLSRIPTEKEQKLCSEFLTRHEKLLENQSNLKKMLPSNVKTVAPSENPATRARENLIQVIFNHNDFVTIR